MQTNQKRELVNWCAGFFDASGTFTAQVRLPDSSKKLSLGIIPRMQLRSGPEVLSRFQQLFGGNIYNEVWVLTGWSTLQKALNCLMPHLVMKQDSATHFYKLLDLFPNEKVMLGTDCPPEVLAQALKLAMLLNPNKDSRQQARAEQIRLYADALLEVK